MCQEIPGIEAPDVIEDDCSKASILTGEFWGRTRPVIGIVPNPRYPDISLPLNRERTIKEALERNTFTSVFVGMAILSMHHLPCL